MPQHRDPHDHDKRAMSLIAEVKDQEADHAKWTCVQCTLINVAAARTCATCGFEKSENQKRLHPHHQQGEEHGEHHHKHHHHHHQHQNQLGEGNHPLGSPSVEPHLAAGLIPETRPPPEGVVLPPGHVLGLDGTVYKEGTYEIIGKLQFVN